MHFLSCIYRWNCAVTYLNIPSCFLFLHFPVLNLSSFFLTHRHRL
uniref:Uncharacterized protein n=1 Tax=Rhizophora mucronata TaxID=61149 RepID=A0A2P2NCK6_RHIMU